MKTRTPDHDIDKPDRLAAPASSALASRRCACGAAAGLSGQCTSCAPERLATSPPLTSSVQPLLATASSVVPGLNRYGNNGGDVDLAALRGRLQQSFGPMAARVAIDLRSDLPHGALGMTVGQRVQVDSSRLRLDMSEGLMLIGHEVAHALQQGRSDDARDNETSVEARRSELEAEAHEAGQAFAQGLGFQVQRRALLSVPLFAGVQKDGVAAMGTEERRYAVQHERAWSDAHPEGRWDMSSTDDCVLWNFAIGQHALKAEHKLALDKILERWRFVRIGPDTSIRVDGYASASGTGEENTALARGRALAAWTYLQSRSVTNDRIYWYSHGSAAAKLPASTAAALARNRRVEVRILRPAYGEQAAEEPKQGGKANSVIEVLEMPDKKARRNALLSQSGLWGMVQPSLASAKAAIALEALLGELEQRGYLDRLFTAVEAAGVWDLQRLFLDLAAKTRYKAHPRVKASRAKMQAQRMAALEHTYRPEQQTIWLEHEPALAVQSGEVMAQRKAAYSITYPKFQIKPGAQGRGKQVPAVMNAVAGKEMQALLISGGETSNDAFLNQCIADAMSEVGITEEDFEEVQVCRSVRLKGIKQRQAEGVEGYSVSYEIVEWPEGDEARLMTVQEVKDQPESQFEKMLWEWRDRRRADAAIVMSERVAALAGLAAASELSALRLLSRVGGGSASVLISVLGSMLGSVLYKVVTGEEITSEGLLLSALEGYLWSVGFSIGGILAKKVLGLLGAGKWSGKILAKLIGATIKGLVAGSVKGLMQRFCLDVAGILAGSGEWSSVEEYIAQMEEGVLVGMLTMGGELFIGLLKKLYSSKIVGRITAAIEKRLGRKLVKETSIEQVSPMPLFSNEVLRELAQLDRELAQFLKEFKQAASKIDLTTKKTLLKEFDALLEELEAPVQEQLERELTGFLKEIAHDAPTMDRQREVALFKQIDALLKELDALLDDINCSKPAKTLGLPTEKAKKLQDLAHEIQHELTKLMAEYTVKFVEAGHEQRAISAGHGGKLH